MKKIIFLFLLTCCSSDLVVEELEPVQTTEIVVNTTTELLDTDLMIDNFHKWWIEYKLKDSNIYLNPTEVEYTNNLISEFLIDDRDTYDDPFIYYPYKNNPFSRAVIFDLHDSYEGQFTISPSGAAGTGFNEVTYTYESEFLDVEANGLDFTVKKVDDYDWAGWVNTTILFDFPLVEGAELPFEGYELLSVGVNVIFNVIGEAYEVNFPALKARLLDTNGITLQEVTSSINDGQGNFVFTNIEPGTYRMVIGSDINGDNSWGGPGEMSGSSENFEITDTNVSNLAVTLSPELAGAINNAPVITTQPFTDAYVNQPYFYGVRADDEDGDALSYSIELINRETGASADFLSIASNGAVTGTPREDDIGEYDARVIVSDGVDAAVQEFILTVNE